MKIAEVFLNQKNKRIDHAYDYAIPESLREKIQPGGRIVVPFGRGNRQVEGFVIAIKEVGTYTGRTKEVLELIDNVPILLEEQIALCLWMKAYYCSLFYEALSLFTSVVKVTKESRFFWEESKSPETLTEKWFYEKYIKGENGFKRQSVKVEDKNIFNNLITDGFLYKKNTWKIGKEKELLPFLEEKKDLANEIHVTLRSQEDEIFRKYKFLSQSQRKTLFYSFDSSGKFRLYFKIIEDTLKNNKNVLVLFPEVTMTVFKMEMFYKYFKDQVGVFHGKLSQKDRFLLYEKVKKGKIRVIVGVRTALFFPLKNLGLIIIDEEHDPSYRGMSAPRFNTKDVAEKYCELTGARLIIGDEIPNIGTYYEAKTHKMNLFQIGSQKTPKNKIEIVDMQKEIQSGNMSFLSRALLVALGEGLKENRLSVLLLNKKGYATCLFCRDCGYVEKCPHCGVALKYLGSKNILKCHYCGYEKKPPKECPKCGCTRIKALGFGIDQAESIIKKQFPKAQVLSVQGGMKPNEIKKVNKDIQSGKIDILIGTQIVTKNFDLSKVGLATALSIDQDLNQGDYRATENGFRTYRRFFNKAMKEGTLGIIQTNDPENETIYSIVNDSYDEFFNSEIIYRKMLNYPPYEHMIVFGIFQKNEKEVEQDAFKFYIELKAGMASYEKKNEYDLFKPVNAGVLSGGNRNFQIILKVKNLEIFQKVMKTLIELGSIEKLKSKISIEVNP